METRKLLNFVNNYLFGNKELKEIDVEFQIALEEKILSLKDSESLFWYCDYEDRGNLFDFYTSFVNSKNEVEPRCGVQNKSGIKIYNKNGKIFVETKTGYGANWLLIHN